MSPAPDGCLRLRGQHVPIVWPTDAPRGLLVLVGAQATRELADRYGAVVLSASADNAETVIAWATDHASELGVTGPVRVTRRDS